MLCKCPIEPAAHFGHFVAGEGAKLAVETLRPGSHPGSRPDRASRSVHDRAKEAGLHVLSLRFPMKSAFHEYHGIRP